MPSKQISLLIFLVLFALQLFPGEQKIRLRIPLRIAADSPERTILNKGNIILKVNGEKREITDLVERERTLTGTADLGRNFILSFQLTEYSEQVEKGIAYFVTEIIHPDDSLIVVSPTTFYQINVSGNKEKMIRDIKQLLEKDCQNYKKDRVAVEKNLRLKIKNLQRVLREIKASRGSASRGNRDASQLGVRQILELTQFLDTFPREFVKFRELSLLLDTSKYRKIVDLLGFREGERWWLHFHREEVTALLSYIKAFMKELNAYVVSRESKQIKKLLNLEKVLSISASFPSEQVLATIINGNICYNVVSLGGIRINDQEAKETETSGVERILHRIALESGGKSASVIDPEQGIKEIAAQKDIYYELTFPFDGIFEKKEIEITTGNKRTTLRYKGGFEKDELETLVHNLSHEQVAIDDFSSNKNVIKFTVKSFKHHKEEKFAMLKVNIELVSDMDTVVYRTQNTLRSSQKKVTIRIPFPEKYCGRFKVRITVNDLLANRRAAIDRDITL